MSVGIEAVIHIAWDEVGRVAASAGGADEAADLLDGLSCGRFRRVLALRLQLPPATPIAMSMTLAETDAAPTVRRA